MIYFIDLKTLNELLMQIQLNLILKGFWVHQRLSSSGQEQSLFEQRELRSPGPGATGAGHAGAAAAGSGSVRRNLIRLGSSPATMKLVWRDAGWIRGMWQKQTRLEVIYDLFIYSHHRMQAFCFIWL